MDSWSRLVPFESKANQIERWICQRNGEVLEETKVDVTLGKPIDILSLKIENVENFAQSVDTISSFRKQLFSGPLEQVTKCPICASDSIQARQALSDIYGARYVRCSHCSHHFILNRPSKKTIEEIYSANSGYQSTYTDKRSLEVRVAQVASPKVDWCIAAYEKQFGKRPQSVLDVGAGSGHFVYAARKAGLKADGVELSDSGRAFSKEHFGVELINRDFVKEYGSFSSYDLITFWGVIEHVPFPLEMLSAARNLAQSGNNTFVVAEVPRWNCFSTAVQSHFSTSVVRHLEPFGHINVFTDSSLAQAFSNTGFKVKSAWYFGMDAYELVVQSANLLKNPGVIEQMSRLIPTFQASFDSAKLCDEMVFGAVLK